MGYGLPHAVRRPELLLSDRHLQVYLIKQLMDGRSGGGQQQSGEGGGAASSPSTGESPHGGSGRESRQRRSLGADAHGGVNARALLALDDRQRVRLLSLLVQLETQTLALQARHPFPGLTSSNRHEQIALQLP
jgi:hypothetical protein